MSKLLKVLEWVTVPQAAKHLSALVGEEVTEADVLRLALDRHLTLSVNFVNHATAHLGRSVPYKDVPKNEVPPMRADGQPGSEPRLLVSGFLFEDVDELTAETPFICFDEAVVTLTGVWDLSMCGGERIEIEHRYQHLTDGPPVELIDINGSFVRRQDGSWAQLLAQHPDRWVEDASEKKKIRGDYYPMSGLPEDGALVVRTAELTRFQSALSNADNTHRKAVAPLDPRSETTYLTIIGALLELVRNPRSGRDSDAAVIRELIENYSDKPGISKTTLEAKFADARRRLNST